MITNDITYMVNIFKDHYPQPTPKDQGDGWYPAVDPPSSSYAPIHASQHDAQLTHIVDMI